MEVVQSNKKSLHQKKLYFPKKSNVLHPLETTYHLAHPKVLILNKKNYNYQKIGFLNKNVLRKNRIF